MFASLGVITLKSVLIQYLETVLYVHILNQKNNQPRFPTKYDDYEKYYDYERDQFIIKRKRDDNEN